MLALQKYMLKLGGAMTVAGGISAGWGLWRMLAFIRDAQAPGAPETTTRDVFIHGVVLPHVALLMGTGIAMGGVIILLRAFVFKPAGLKRSLEKTSRA